MSAEPIHAQRIRPSKLGLILAGFAVLNGGIGVAVNLNQGPITATLILAGAMLLFTLLSSAFWELRLVVNTGDIELGWGWPFERRLPFAQVSEASVQPYPAMRFMGWGLRRAVGGDWAFSDFGVKEALVLKLADGKQIFVTLKDPQASASAVAQAVASNTPSN
jgi:hypothetical protein